jgi:hypothetical protein
VSTILNWILKRVTFRLYNSSTPIGRRLGGHNIPDVVDSYIILELSIAGITAFTGYFQTS